MSPKITERTIRAMPYEVRIQHYNREKNELYLNTKLTGERLEEERLKLEKKWRV